MVVAGQQGKQQRHGQTGQPHSNQQRHAHNGPQQKPAPASETAGVELNDQNAPTASANPPACNRPPAAWLAPDFLAAATGTGCAGGGCDMVCVALETRLDVSADVDAARWVCRVAEIWVREEEEEAEGEEGGLSAKDNHTAVSSELVSRSVTLDVDKGCKFAGCQDCADRLV